MRGWFTWTETFQRRLRQAPMPRLAGETLLIASDYSGSDRRSKYEVYSFLITSPYEWHPWRELRAAVREEYLRDGRRLSFKALNDRRRQVALPHFLQAALALPGLCLTLIVDKSIDGLSGGELLLPLFQDGYMSCKGVQMHLCHRWSRRAFEKMARTTQFLALLISELVPRDQNIVWVSDEDELFGGAGRTADLLTMLGFWGALYIGRPRTDLSIGTTAIDSEDRLLEDLASIPDLAAGATREYINAAIARAGRRLPTGLVVDLPAGLSTKTRTVLEWMCMPSRLSHFTMLFQEGDGGFHMSRIVMT